MPRAANCAMSEYVSLAYEDDDDPLVTRDEALFFQIVQTTPDTVEADDLLRRAKTAVLRMVEEARELGDGREEQRLNNTLTRLNSEIHYQTQIENRSRFREAAERVFGPGAWEKIREARMRLLAQNMEAAERDD